MKSYKSLLCLLLSFLLLLPLFCMPALAEEADETQDTALTLSCPSAVLMEASTGCILYEKDAVARLPMASVTKVMTDLSGNPGQRFGTRCLHGRITGLFGSR